jgi:hypothetical protein
VWLAGNVSRADHAIVHDEDVHVAVLPAGIVAPSMKSAACVVACDTYAGNRVAWLVLEVIGGTAMTIVPCALAAATGFMVTSGRAGGRLPDVLPLQALNQMPASTMDLPRATIRPT